MIKWPQGVAKVPAGKEVGVGEWVVVAGGGDERGCGGEGKVSNSHLPLFINFGTQTCLSEGTGLLSHLLSVGT